jgi:hypothetical protein
VWGTQSRSGLLVEVSVQEQSLSTPVEMNLLVASGNVKHLAGLWGNSVTWVTRTEADKRVTPGKEMESKELFGQANQQRGREVKKR